MTQYYHHFFRTIDGVLDKGKDITKYIYKDKGEDIESVLAILCETFRKVSPILESFGSCAMAWICL